MHRQRDTRRNLLIRARMRAGGPAADVCIRNVSSQGLMIQAETAPPRGTYVEIAAGDQLIVGRIAWSKDRRFGIRTRDRVDVLALLGARAPGDPARGALRCARQARIARTEALRPCARAMEFAAVGLIAALLVAAVGGSAFQAMAGPLASVSAQLDGR